MAKRKYDFLKALDKSTTEEEVKAAYIREFDIETTIRDAVDLRTDNVLFEFKNRKPFANNKSGKTNRVKTLAQALYYVHRCKFGNNTNSIPNQIIISEQSTSVIYISKEWEKIYSDKKFDWERSPSSPDSLLVEACREHEMQLNVTADIFQMQAPQELELFRDNLKNYIGAENIPTDTKVVSETNFEDVFEHWKSVIGEFLDVKDFAIYFLRDLQNTPSYDTEKGVLTFTFRGIAEEFSIPPKTYKRFWMTYKRPPTQKALEAVFARADRLNCIDKRRFNGEFYTPLVFAKKGLEYIAAELGDDWYKEYKIWDMACGTGNLEYHIPDYTNVYMSTLDADEVIHMNSNNLFPGATIFQYDYLNDDVDLVMNPIDADLMGKDYVALLDDSLGWKLPRQLREDLVNPDNKWVVLMNPPFATSCTSIGDKQKAGVNDTGLKQYMKKMKLGNSVRELFTQFLFRISIEVPNPFLGLFSTLKIINAPDSQKFREKLFHAKYMGGFIFPISVFIGTKGSFPVGFTIWKLGKKIDTEIKLNVLNAAGEHIGDKILNTFDAKQGLNNWVSKPKQTMIMPPFSSALSPAKKVYTDKVSKDFIGVLFRVSNDIQHQQQTALFSTANSSNANYFSINSDNFEKSMVLNAVRKIIKHTWTNDRDQFKQPNQELPIDFINDSVIWSLFNGCNNSSSLKDVEYKGDVYQIKNEFYPFLIEQVEQWETRNSLRNEKDRFVAKWLQSANLSKEASDVLTAAKKIYELYYEEIANLNIRKYKLDNWDAGWYQIRFALKDAGLGETLFEQFATVYKTLTEKLRPKVYEYGFLDREELFE